MVAWRDDIELTVEIAFGDAPKATTPTWTDVSDYVRVDPPIRIDRGTSSELSGISPGTMSLHLDNRDRRFDPDYTFGPYYGDLVPMTKIRLTAQLSVTSVTLFTGYVLGWKQHWTLGGDGTVEITAVDGSRFVSNAQLASSAYGDAIVDTADLMVYYPLQTATDLIDLGPDDENAIIGRDRALVAPTLETKTLPHGEPNALTSSDESNFAASWTTAKNEVRSVEAWIYGSGVGSTILASYTDNWIRLQWSDGVVTADFSSGSETLDDEISANFRTGGSHVVATATISDSTLRLYVDGRLVESKVMSGSGLSGATPNRMLTEVNVNASVSHVAYYTSALSASTVLNHYLAGATAYGHPYGERSGERIDRVLDEIGWPAGQRSIDTGDTVQGPYLPDGQTFLDYARYVADSERGLLYFDVDGNIRFKGRNALWLASQNAVTFSDDGGTSKVRYFAIEPAPNHVDNIRNIVTTSYSTVGAITRRDQTSIDAYGEGREFVDCPTIPNARTASSLSAYVLRERKDPSVFIQRLDCHMRLRDGLNEFDTLAAVELGDIINVEHTPLGVGSPAERTVMVTGVSHTIDAAQWDVSLFCSAAPTQYDDAPYLVVGDAVYGKIGATAGNKIPF